MCCSSKGESSLLSYLQFSGCLFFLFHLLGHVNFFGLPQFWNRLYFLLVFIFVVIIIFGVVSFWGLSLNIGMSSFFRAKQCNMWSDWVIWDQAGGNRAKRGQTGPHGAKQGQMGYIVIHSHTWSYIVIHSRTWSYIGLYSHT